MTALSERLKTITQMVTPCGVAADIGCDHCLSLMNLLKNKKCERGIGSDIKSGPIGKARENLQKYGYESEIELRTGYGLSTIKESEAEAIIISGMGGRIINDIISAGLSVAKSASQLIIQPQNEVCAVRRSLHTLGFKIHDEKMVLEEGKFYTVIEAAPGEEKYDNETYYLYGAALIHKKDEILARFLSETLAENERIALALQDRFSEKCVLRLAEIECENKMIKEVLLCL